MALLTNPVWAKCPPICETARLPMLKTLPELMVWLSAHGPRCEIKRVWQCTDCGGFHAETVAPDPAGSTSGTTRYQRHKDD